MKFVDLDRQYQELKSEIDAHMGEVISNSSFIMGSKVKELEEQLASFVGAKHAIACGSGTDALLLALMTFNLKPGDEIITTPFSFIAAGEVISFMKAKPVFVDIDEQTFNINAEEITRAITDRTKGIIPVDIFGQCANYDEINKIAQDHNLFVIEDAAQSFGAKYKGRPAGSLGNIGCTSFFPAKPFGCYGDGGMIFLNNDDKAALIKSLRIHGMGDNKYDNIRIGINSRLDTLQAAVLLAKLKTFPREIEARNRIAQRYTEQLKEPVIPPKILDHNVSAFAQYSIRIDKRNELQTFLRENGIPTAIHYPKPLHLQAAFTDLKHIPGDFPVAENVCKNILALPIHPFLQDNEQEKIIETINLFINN